MGKKILVIDDEEQDRKGMAIVLEKGGYNEVGFAETGDQGVAVAQSFDPELIFIDVVLQNVDGFDVCKEMREKGITAKIIMITGHLDAVNAKKAVKSGADEIIEKQAGFGNVCPTIDRVA